MFFFHNINNVFSIYKCRLINCLICIGTIVIVNGCGSAYSNLTSASGLGAGQYIPAVLVPPENQVTYDQVLATCRQVAQNKQATAAQEAQLKTLTGALSGTVAGATSGLELGSLFKSFGGDASKGEMAAIGAATGLVTSLVSSFTSGAEANAAETKAVLLKCLRATSQDGELWKVLE